MKNYLIEIYRFAFMSVIVMLHLSASYRGSLDMSRLNIALTFPDFFFVLSGFFMALSAEKQSHVDSHDVASFFFNKVRHFYPVYLIGTVMAWCVFIFMLHASIPRMQVLLDIFLLSPFLQIVNGPAWFLCVLLWMSPVTYFVIVNCRKWIYVFAPLIIVEIYYSLFCTFHVLNVWNQPHWGTIAGVWRCIAGLLVGCLVHEAYGWYSRHRNYIYPELFNKAHQQLNFPLLSQHCRGCCVPTARGLSNS